MPALPTSVAADPLPTEVDLGSQIASTSPSESGSRNESRQGLQDAMSTARGETPPERAPTKQQEIRQAEKTTPKPNGKEPAKANVQKEPEKVDATKPDPKPPEKTPNGQAAAPKENFIELKDKARRWDAGELPPRAQEKLTAAEKQANEFQAKLAALQAEYETDKGRYTENQTWRMAFEMQQSPEYQQNVVEPFNAVRTFANSIGERYSVDKAALWEAITTADVMDRADKLEALLADNPKRATIDRLLQPQIDRMEQIVAKDGEMQGKAAELRNQINANRQTQTAQQTHAQRIEEDKARTEVAAIIDSLVEFDEDTPSEVKQFIAQSKDAKFEDSPMSRAMAARLPDVTMAMKHLIEHLKTKMASEIASRDATIEEFSASRTGGMDTPPGDSQNAPPTDARSALRSAMAHMGGRG